MSNLSPIKRAAALRQPIREDEATTLRAPKVTVQLPHLSVKPTPQNTPAPTVEMPTPSARQNLLYSAPNEDKWYKGDAPTLGETLARIKTRTGANTAEGQQLYTQTMQFAFDPTTPVYNPYLAATNPAVASIGALGWDVSGGVDADWISRNSALMGHYRTGNTLTPLAPTSTSTPQQDAAYHYYKITEAEQTTQKAEAEWAALQEELNYWAQRTDRNYSDEEILSRINWSDYPTLTKMDEGRKQGVPLSLNRAIGYSQDAMYGTLWAARNGKSTGNAMADSMAYYLQMGKSWEENAEVSARLDPTSDRYNPYALGCTMDDAALYFGVSGFGPEWLEQNRSYLAGQDETAKKMWNKVYDAEQRTLKAEEEYKALTEEMTRLMQATQDPDAILRVIDWEEDYPTLSKLDESLRTGEILDMTRGVSYSRADVESALRKSLEEAAAKPDTAAWETNAVQALAAPSGSATVTPLPEGATVDTIDEDADDADGNRAQTLLEIGIGVLFPAEYGVYKLVNFFNGEDEEEEETEPAEPADSSSMGTADQLAATPREHRPDGNSVAAQLAGTPKVASVDVPAPTASAQIMAHQHGDSTGRVNRRPNANRQLAEAAAAQTKQQQEARAKAKAAANTPSEEDAVRNGQTSRLDAAGADIATQGSPSEQAVWQSGLGADTAVSQVAKKISESGMSPEAYLTSRRVSIDQKVLADPQAFLRACHFATKYTQSKQRLEAVQAEITKVEAEMAKYAEADFSEFEPPFGVRANAATVTVNGINVHLELYRDAEQAPYQIDEYRVADGETHLYIRPVAFGEKMPQGISPDNAILQPPRFLGESYTIVDKETGTTIATASYRSDPDTIWSLLADVSMQDLQKAANEELSRYNKAARERSYVESLPGSLESLKQEAESLQAYIKDQESNGSYARALYDYRQYYMSDEEKQYAADIGYALPESYAVPVFDFVAGFAEYTPTDHTATGWSIFDQAVRSGQAQEDVAASAQVCVTSWQVEMANIDYCLQYIKEMGLTDSLRAQYETYEVPLDVFGVFTIDQSRKITPDYIQALQDRRAELTGLLEDAHWFLRRFDPEVQEYVNRRTDQYWGAYGGLDTRDIGNDLPSYSWYDPTRDPVDFVDRPNDVSDYTPEKSTTWGEYALMDYLAETGKTEELEQYQKWHETRLNKRSQYAQATYAYNVGQERPVDAAFGSVRDTVIGGIESAIYIIGNVNTDWSLKSSEMILGDMLGIEQFQDIHTPGEYAIDPYSDSFDVLERGANMRQGSRDHFVTAAGGLDATGGKVAGFIFDAATTIGDSAFSTFVGFKASPAILGLASFGRTTQSALLRGASQEEALTLGTVSFVAEAGTEMLFKYDVDKAMKAGSAGEIRSFLTGSLRSAGVEGLGEGVAELVETASDATIMKAKSQYWITYNACRDAGMTEAECTKMACKDALGQITYATVLGTAVSGVSDISAGTAAHLKNRGRSSASKLTGNDITAARLQVLDSAVNSSPAAQASAIAAVLDSADTEAQTADNTGTPKQRNRKPPAVASRDILQESMVTDVESTVNTGSQEAAPEQQAGQPRRKPPEAATREILQESVVTEVETQGGQDSVTEADVTQTQVEHTPPQMAVRESLEEVEGEVNQSSSEDLEAAGQPRRKPPEIATREILQESMGADVEGTVNTDSQEAAPEQQADQPRRKPPAAASRDILQESMVTEVKGTANTDSQEVAPEHQAGQSISQPQLPEGEEAQLTQALRETMLMEEVLPGVRTETNLWVAEELSHLTGDTASALNLTQRLVALNHDTGMAETSQALRVSLILPDGRARKALNLIVGKHKSDGQIPQEMVSRWLQAAKRDMQENGDAYTAANVNIFKMMEDRLAARLVQEQVANGALDGLESYRVAVDSAQSAWEHARSVTERAKQLLSAAQQTLSHAMERFQEILENPKHTPEDFKAANNDLVDAGKQVQERTSSLQQLTEAGEQRLADLRSARQTLKDKAEQILTKLRQDAILAIGNAKSQQAARLLEKSIAAQEKAAQEAAMAEEYRLARNTLAMEVEAFLNDVFPDASEEQQDQLREEYITMYSDHSVEPTPTARESNDAIPTTDQATETDQTQGSPVTQQPAQATESSRHATELMSRLSRTFRVSFRVTDGQMGGVTYRGAHSANGEILISQNATQDELLYKTLVHELTHHAESSKAAYNRFAKDLLSFIYDGNQAQMDADMAAIRQRYSAALGDSITDQVVEQELVAAKAEELLGNEESINRIVDKKPSLASRIWQTLKGFVKRIAGVQSSQADRIRQAETLFRKALETVGIKTTGEMQLALKDTATIPWTDQVDMTAKQQIPGSATLTVTNGLTLMPQIGEQNLPVGMYISDFRKVTRDTSSNRSAHGLSLDTMRAFPEALSNPVAWFDNPSRNSLYVVTSLTDEQGLPVVAVINKNQTDNVGAPMHRLISAYGMRNILQYMEDHLPDGARYFIANKEAFSMMAGSQYTMTESDYRSLENRFTEIVPQESDAVNTPVTDSLSGIQFSNPVPVLPSPEIRAAQMADYHAQFVSGAFDGDKGNGSGGSFNSETDAPDNGNLGERQFTGKTLQRSMAIPMQFKNELFRNPQGRYYVRDTNDGQIARAIVRLEQDGVDATVERLESMDHIADKDDIAMINLLTGLANAPAEIGGLADPELLSRMLLLNAEQGTEIGQALQARQIFDRLSPMEQQARMQGKLEQDTAEYIDKHSRQIKRLYDRAQQVENQIRDLRGGDEMLRLTEGTVITESNSRWGIPVNEQQQALIDHYGLNNVPRPGLFYNRATIKQRMLEAILASPNPLALTGMGMNLIHRLELLNAGIPVTTVADNNYIGQNLTEYAYADHDTQNSRDGYIPLARAFEAYANITPATSKAKLRTIRYINMLMRGGSAARNIIGNSVQTAVNEVSHAVSAALDTGVSLFTHERTTAIVPAKGQIEGFKAFAKGFMDQVRDIYFDRVNTQESIDRYSLTEHGGRVFQSSIPEALRNFEVFLMSMGDRPFFQRAYATSMAESHKLARINGVELDYAQAHERAMQEALFATFNEDSKVRNAIQQFKRTAGPLGEALDFIIPFTGVPTNIIRRSYQYSPVYLVHTALKHAFRAARGESFDQRAFVQELGRGLTGTGLFVLGAALYCGGFIRLGTSEEDDDKKRQLMTADGDQYAATLTLGDVQINLSAFNPAAITIGWGAHAIEELDKLNRENPDPNGFDYIGAAFNALCRGGDLIFDASYMASLSDFLGGNGYEGFTVQGGLTTLASSAVSQFTPGVLSDLASGLDPYVRDTKDANVVTQIVKSLANRIPGMRQMLPAKVDVTGQRVENTDYGVAAFFDPFNRTYGRDDPAIDELMRLQDALGSSGFMPSDALSGTRTSLSGVEAPVEDKDKEVYKRRYGTLWRIGGNTYDKDGNVVHVMGVNELIQQPWYQQLTDAEKAEHIKSVVAAAKTGAAYEAGEKLGHKDKVSSTTAKSSTGEHTAAPLRAAPDKLAGQYPELDRLFAETGDGTFIPKGISNSFQRGGVKYTLADADYEQLWQLYKLELDKRLWKINYYESPDEVADAVSKAYDDAAREAKDRYVEFNKLRD